MRRHDEDILSLLERGDKVRAFELIVDNYQQQIYWHIRRLVVSHEDAQDILQDCFINVFRALDKFEGRSAMYTWLHRIATNEVLHFFRKRKVDAVSVDNVESNVLARIESEVEMGADKVLVEFQKAVATLPETQRLVFNMRYYDELSYNDIAQITGSSVDSLKTNYHYAVKRIKEYLTKSIE